MSAAVALLGYIRLNGQVQNSNFGRLFKEMSDVVRTVSDLHFGVVQCVFQWSNLSTRVVNDRPSSCLIILYYTVVMDE